MRVINVRQNQSLADIALEQYGDVSGVYWLVQDNKLNSIIDDIEYDRILFIREEYINKKVAEELKNTGVATMENTCKPLGIGFQRINELVVN